MDFLLDSAEDLQYEVFRRVSDFLNLDVDLLLFDTTLHTTRRRTNQMSTYGARGIPHIPKTTDPACLRW
ncbi:hypothetical protein SAMN05421799_11347 [Alicyclobacillus vulcanalis]|uniref:Uncharacterized protein n=1 Tax=Alicyclobacillus vulcanalis TaxID=252246 RepID=A0A1N7PH77_9BACL|nr:hypothetical protein SAMN05421799_11347 [Alicyclobacillus vulcanalis]